MAEETPKTKGVFQGEGRFRRLGSAKQVASRVLQPFRKAALWYWARLRAHPFTTLPKDALVAFIAFFLLNFLRIEIQYPILWAWVHLFVIIFVVVELALVFAVFRWRTTRGTLAKMGCTFAVLAFLAMDYEYGIPVHDYITLWVGYQELQVVEIDKEPVTIHERVQPWFGVKTAAHGALGTTLMASDPGFVRDPDGSYKFTMALEPNYIWQRGLLPGTGAITEAFWVHGTSGTLSFGPESRVPVAFDVGENLMLAHNTDNCMVRSFGFRRFFNYEPGNPVYMKDDQGQVVMVVPLVRWDGILFPTPRFGGVQVVPQQEESFARNLSRWIFGCGGYWVRPEEIGNHPFLVGQNLVPDKVSRFIASTFRFRAGFWGPFPGNHWHDIRIPDIADDMRDEPFVAPFLIGNEEKLVQYFALEPYDQTKHGLTLSVFVPGDGIGPVLVHDEEAHQEGLYGPTAIAEAIRISRPQYDWSKNKVVEHRPFIHDICGMRRTMYISTVVALTGSGNGFIGGSVPMVAIADAKDRMVYWVDSSSSDGWSNQVESQMREHGLCHAN